MGILLDFQNFVLSASLGLIPILALIYSFSNSWHCSVMCGPLIAGHSKAILDRFLLVRVASYTVAGAVMGLIGQELKGSAELKLASAVGFLVLIVLTALLTAGQLLPGAKLPSLRQFGHGLISRARNRSALAQGALFAFIPCHLLGFFYGISAMLGRPLLGAALLFTHAVMTTPALAYARKFSRLVAQRPKWTLVVRVVLSLLVAINLFYFGARIFHTEADARSKVLFCL